jgi:carbon storage regulator CsrA
MCNATVNYRDWLPRLIASAKRITRTNNFQKRNKRKLKRSLTMLVLSRRIDETILIDGRIEIQIVRVKGNSVRIGIRAPGDVKILRGELAPFGKEALETNETDSVIEFPNKIAQAG